MDKIEHKPIMVIGRTRGGVAIEAFRVLVPVPGHKQYKNQLSSRNAFRENEHRRLKMDADKAPLIYNVHTDPHRDYESFQGAWERIRAQEGIEVERSTDPEYIRINDALLPFPTLVGMQELYSAIGYVPKSRRYNESSLMARLTSDPEYQSKLFQKAAEAAGAPAPSRRQPETPAQPGLDS